jgi:hypothetical protein
MQLGIVTRIKNHIFVYPFIPTDIRSVIVLFIIYRFLLVFHKRQNPVEE